eukprot:jgi/Psemu1/325521/estExt_fgenesh1_pg.C_2500014
MTSSRQRRGGSNQFKNLKKVYEFDDKDKEEAIQAVQQIAQLAMKNVLDESTRSLIVDFDAPEVPSGGYKFHPIPADLYGEYSQSPFISREKALFRGSTGTSREENEIVSYSIGSRSRTELAMISESPISTFSGIRRRNKKKVQKNSSQNGFGNKPAESSDDAWICGVCAKNFASYEAACRHEDDHIREIVVDLGWVQNRPDRQDAFGGMELQTSQESFVSHDQLQARRQERQQEVAARSHASSRESSGVPGSPLAVSRPDILTVSTRNLSHQFPLSSTENEKHEDYSTEANGFEPLREYPEVPSNHNQPTLHQIEDYVVLADEALTDVCKKAEKLALSQLEREAEFELECYSKDKHYYDVLEQREIERQRDGAYSRFRTEGKNLAQKIQNKFVDAYAVMKQGKSKKAMSSVDHYKRKLEGDSDVKNVMENTKQTLYVNVIVKNSIQVVSHELERLARQRWEEHKKKEGSTDIRNKESREQFEKFKAAAQGQLVQLAGLALASDFTPRRIAVQLSNDLYRLLTPRLKRRGVFIESEIEYRVGPYFVLAVNVLAVDWRRLVKRTYEDVTERRAKWMKSVESDDAKEGVTRRYGPLASLIRLSKMTSMEILAGFLATLYYTPWVIYTPICWFLYRFMIGETFRKYFLSSVTDEIFYYVEQKGMEMNIQIQDAETQAVCMLSALQEIRTDSRALRKKKEKSGSAEGEVELLGPLLGPAIKDDSKPAPPVPPGFEIPENLEFVSLELNLQVGFQRLRWALLSAESSFVKDAVWKTELNYDNIEAGEWNKFNDEIGLAKLPDGVKAEDFIGAERETSYLMPKSAFVAANTAHETAFIETYNDCCFSLKLRALTPDVPYGSTFEAWTKYVVVNTGNNSCKLTCSVEAVFPNGPPMISRQIKSGMRDGVGEVFVKTGEAFQRYADAYP